MTAPRLKMKVAAVVHAAPEYADKEASTAKVDSIIKDAGEQGIKLLAFPEFFIPGYPVCMLPYTVCHIYIYSCVLPASHRHRYIYWTDGSVGG